MVGWAALLIGFVMTPFIPTLPPFALATPLLVSIIVIGLPHGALDHLTAARIWNLEHSSSKLIFYSAYIGLALLYLGLWFIAPILAFTLFILLTIFHWGQGDWEFERRANPPSPDRPILTTITRGGITMILPFVFWPDVFSAVGGWAVGNFQNTTILQPLAVNGTLPLETIGIALFAVIAASLWFDITDWRRTSPPERTNASIRIFETIALTAFFVLVHPLVAIGLYFPFWHGLRHLAGLRHDLAKPSTPWSWRRTFRQAMPLTGVSIVGMAALGILLSSHWQLQSVIGLYLTLLAILTLPHALVVGIRDHFGCVDDKMFSTRQIHTKTITQTPVNHA